MPRRAAAAGRRSPSRGRAANRRHGRLHGREPAGTVAKLSMATEIETPTAASCWACQAALGASDHFCGGCGKVQPAAPVDYFSFFGLPRKLNLDLAALEREFYRLSRKLHPDVCARASAREQQWSLE